MSDARLQRMRFSLCPACKHTERTAMRFQFFHIEDTQSVRFQDLDRADEGKVGEMLVVDCVEFVVLNQAEQMRKFKGYDAFRLEQNLQAFHEIVEVRHLRENVISDNKVGSAPPCDKLCCQSCAE